MIGPLAKCIAASLAAVVLPGAAQACMMHQMETYTLLDRAPPVADGAVMLKVFVPARAIHGGVAIARIVEPAPAIFGAKTIEIRGGGSSCSRWGLVDAIAYVVGHVSRRPGGGFAMRAIETRWTHDPRFPRRPGEPAPFQIYTGDPPSGLVKR